MIVDIKEKARVKFCIRDYEGGGFLPEARRYASEGYDIVCLRKKGMFVPEADGIMPMCECKIGNPASTDGEYTILGLGVTSDPEIPEDWENMIKTSSQKAVEAIKMIHRVNGYALLCDIEKNKNTAEQIMRLEGLDGIEIPEESAICDELVCIGGKFGLLCSGSEFYGGIFIEAMELDAQSVIRALKAGRFYSGEGDGEVHISTLPSGRVRVDCSPASKIEFFTNGGDDRDKVFVGENLICAEYVPFEGERLVRAEITDMQGMLAYTNYIEV